MTATGTPVSVEHGQMADAATTLRQIAQTLTDAVRRMDTDIQGLQATWGGPAAIKFGAGWDEVCRGAIDVLDSLGEMADLLGVNSDEFDSADDALAAALNSTPAPPATSSLRL